MFANFDGYYMSMLNSPHDIGDLEVANALLGDSDALSRRMAETGYLFFRNVIPQEPLAKLLDAITTILVSHGWIKGGNERLDAKAITLPCREGEDKYLEVMDRVVKLESLYYLAQCPELLGLMQSVLGSTAFPHPLSITRLVFPNNPEITTPPHQDYRNNQGTPNLTAAWLPLDDCPRNLGSLAVLEGSHKLGLMPLSFHLGAGNRRAILDERVKGLRWLSADFKVGDVLLFPAMTVHSSLENKDPERMRLSVDFRYQLEGEQLVSQSLMPHFNRVTWEEAYQDWESEDLKYYWQSKNFDLVEWDQSLQDLPDDHLKEAVQQTRNYHKARADRQKLQGK